MALSVLEVLQKDDLEKRKVSVPQWGGDVWIRSLRADERSEIERLTAKKPPASDPGHYRRIFLQRTLINEDGSPFATEEQMKELMKKSAAAVETLFDAAAELNGYTERDVKELEKN